MRVRLGNIGEHERVLTKSLEKLFGIVLMLFGLVLNAGTGFGKSESISSECRFLLLWRSVSAILISCNKSWEDQKGQ